MEKISRIVPGNSRVASTDMKNAAPVRPGMPTFGRPVGESTDVVHKSSSTASRAVALHNANIEAKKAASEERVIQKLADDFFMSRIRRPAEEELLTAAPPISLDSPLAATVEPEEGVDMVEEEAPVGAPPQDYTPRGSFVDVRA